MEDMKQLLSLVDGLSRLFEEMIELEGRKLDAIAVNDVEKLDQYMKEEQAYSLKMRGLDSKREKLQEDLGFGGLTLKEIIAQVDPKDAERLLASDMTLRKMIEELKSAVACTKKYIELHLYSLQMLLDQAEKKDGAIYDNKGDKPQEDPPANKFTPKRV